MKERLERKAREGRLFGRTNSKRKANVAVYCDAVGWTCVSLWSFGRKPPTLRMTTEEARVLKKALGEYLDAA